MSTVAGHGSDRVFYAGLAGTEFSGYAKGIADGEAEEGIFDVVAGHRCIHLFEIYFAGT